MRIIRASFEQLPNPLIIGMAREAGATRVEVDCRSILNAYPDATVALSHEPPGGMKEDAYPVVTRVEDGILIWEVQPCDLAREGRGRVQLSVLGQNREVYKSQITQTLVRESLGEATGAPPSNVLSWLDEAAQRLHEAEQAVQRANQAADAARDSADDLKRRLDAGELNGKDGVPGPQGEDAPQIADEAITSTQPWSSLGIVERLCLPVCAQGNPVQLDHPVTGYPLGVTVTVEPVQHFDWVYKENVPAGRYYVPAAKGQYWAITLEADAARVEVDCYTGKAQIADAAAGMTAYAPLESFRVDSTSDLTALNAVNMELTAPAPYHPCVITGNTGSVTIEHGNGDMENAYPIALPEGFTGGVLDITGGSARKTWKKQVLTGNEKFNISTRGFVSVDVNADTFDVSLNQICTIAVKRHNWSGAGFYAESGKVFFGRGFFETYRIDTAAFADFVAAQYASGAPVTIWYSVPPEDCTIEKKNMNALPGVNVVSTDAQHLEVTARADTLYLLDMLMQRVAELELAAVNG